MKRILSHAKIGKDAKEYQKVWMRLQVLRKADVPLKGKRTFRFDKLAEMDDPK